VSRLSRIVLDDSIFDGVHRHPDWPDAQADRWYQAPVSGLNINDNCVDVHVTLNNGEVQLQVRPLLPDSVSACGRGRTDRVLWTRAEEGGRAAGDRG
jgi:D-alanyl-D-alanine carboxypeptidase